MRRGWLSALCRLRYMHCRVRKFSSYEMSWLVWEEPVVRKGGSTAGQSFDTQTRVEEKAV